jgi:signal recognition particle GTPase
VVVFKRLRDGIFKRQDADQDALETVEESADESAVGEAAAVDVAPDELEEVEARDALDEQAAELATPPPAVTLAPNADRSATPAPPAPVDEARDGLETPDEIEDAEEVEAVGQRRGFFNPFKLSLGRTRQLFGRVNDSLAHEEITDDLWDELEETLISSDVGVQTTERIMGILHERATAEQMTHGAELRAALKEELELLLGEPEPLMFSDSSPITVLLLVGVNGVGKTTSIAKLANLLKRQKHRVMLAAGDTFRAAAVQSRWLTRRRWSTMRCRRRRRAEPTC